VVVGPMLPRLGQKIPAWRPAPRLAPPWRWLVFGALATGVTIGTIAFVVFK